MLSLKFRVHPSGGTSNQLLGYVGGVQDTTPATIGAVGELLPAVVLGKSATTPTEWQSVSKSDLAGPLPWYKSVAGSADPTEEAPGVLCLIGTGTEVLLIELKGVMAFKTAVNTANTPLYAEVLRKMREERVRSEQSIERDRLLKVLAPAAVTSTPGRPT
jgi:hypothetical protein